MLWRHVIISTVNSWLPGDPRGFRTLHHKIHSSGDYKNPPPPGEHAGLHRYSDEISKDAVIIPWDLRAIVGKKLVEKLKQMEYRVLAVAVAGMHSHMLAELPEDVVATRKIVGQCKSASSHAIREHLPGRVWGHLGKFKPVRSTKHQRNTYHYILEQEDAWVWSFRDGERENRRTSLKDG
jgi:REP element-mobilizing transposase RayT